MEGKLNTMCLLHGLEAGLVIMDHEAAKDYEFPNQIDKIKINQHQCSFFSFRVQRHKQTITVKKM